MANDVRAGAPGAGPAFGGETLGVFISYSRDDIETADILEVVLENTGFAPTLDRQGISGAEDWKQRLSAMIHDTDTVVFVLSPLSARSDICKWEVGEAVRFGKRIIPVASRPLDGATPPTELAALNYIYFYAEPRMPGSGIRNGAAELVKALRTDLGWLREQTRYLQRATEWEAGGKAPNRLLSGADIALAKAWAARRPKDAPAPTALHVDFISASEIWAAQQQSEELQRLKDRERLVKDRESAQVERDAHAKRARRRTWIGIAVAVALTCVTTVFALWGVYLRSDATTQRELAEAARQAANQAQSETLQLRPQVNTNRSVYLAGLAANETARGDAATGLLLALEALPDTASEDAEVRNRPYVAAAEVSLEGGQRLMREKAVLKRHNGPVRSAAFSPDGARIVTSSDDKTAKVWDSRTGAALAVLNGHAGPVWSVVVYPNGNHVVTGSEDGTVKVWEANTIADTNAVRTLPVNAGPIYSLTMSPNGARILAGTGDGTVKVWDANTFDEVRVLKCHKKPVRSIAVSPDGNYFVTGSDDWTAKVWDARTFAELASLEGHTKALRSVAVSPNGTRIITGSLDGTARVWERRTGDLKYFAEIARLSPRSPVTSVAVSPNGERIVTGSLDDMAWLWDAGTFVELATFKGHSDWVRSVAISPDNARIVTASVDGTARVWDAETSVGFVTLGSNSGELRSVAASPDGARIVAGSADGTVKVWEANTLEKVRTLTVHTGRVNSVALDATRIVTGSDDGTAKVWDARTFAELKTLSGHTDAVNAVAMSPDGTLIVTGSGDKTAKVWDAFTYVELGTFTGHIDAVLSAAVSPDSARVVTGSADKTVGVWDARTSAKIKIFEAHTDWVRSVAFSLDGTRIVTSSDDRTAKVWDATTFALLATLTKHTNAVLSAAISRDGSRIVTSSADNTVRIWNARTFDELAVLNGHSGPVYGVAVSPGGSRIYSGSSDETAKVWDIFPTGQALVEQARTQAPRCLTPEQRQRYNLTPAPPRWCAAMQKWPFDDITTALLSKNAGER